MESEQANPLTQDIGLGACSLDKASSRVTGSVLGRIETKSLILSAMAERIKDLYKNSAKWGTAGRSKPNSTTPPQPSEPNSEFEPEQQKPNSDTLILQRGRETSLKVSGSRFNNCKTWIKDLASLQLSAEDEAGGDQRELTSYEKEGSDDSRESSDTTGKRVIRPDPEGSDGSSSEDNENDVGDGSSSDEDKAGDAETDRDECDATNSEGSSTPEDTSPSVASEPQIATGNPDTPPAVSCLPPIATRDDLLDAQRPSEMVDGPLKGVAYYRTSTEEESDENARITKDQQEPLVEAAFKAFGIKPAHEPITDRAISGEKFDERPGLEKIEELVEAGEINVVVVSDIDRLGRICEKTIEFVKRLRYEYDVYMVANVRWYDVSNGDDLETFNAKAGRAEAENKKRGGRGNRGKLFKLVEHGSDAYLSWFDKVPVACVKDEGPETGTAIKLADDERRDIPLIVLEEFMALDADRYEYARTEEKVWERLDEEYDREFDIDLDVKDTLTNSIYTGRAVIQITEAETHSVDQAKIGIEMEDLQIYDEEHLEMWEQAQQKIRRLDEKYGNKTESRPEKLLYAYGPEMVDDVVASWTLKCPKCGSTSDYEYYGTTTDVDGTKRQKCKCTGTDDDEGEDDSHFFPVPSRSEWEALEERANSDEDKSKTE